MRPVVTSIKDFIQHKCEVDWGQVANAAAWGGLAGAALPFAGTSLASAAGLGALAGGGQYLAGQAISGDSITAEVWR